MEIGRRELLALGCITPSRLPSSPSPGSASVICSPKMPQPRKATFKLIQKRTKEGLRKLHSRISELSLSLALGSLNLEQRVRET